MSDHFNKMKLYIAISINLRVLVSGSNRSRVCSGIFSSYGYSVGLVDIGDGVVAASVKRYEKREVIEEMGSGG